MEKQCKIINDNINAFIDGELDNRRKQEVESHLRLCDHCRGVYESLGAVAGALDRLEWSRAPAGFPRTVRAAAEERNRENSYVTDFLGWRAMPALARIAATIAIFFGLSAGAFLGYNTYHTELAVAAELEITEDEDFMIDDRYFSTIPLDDLSADYLAFIDLGEYWNEIQ